MRAIQSAFLALALAGLALAGGPELTLPAEVKGRPGAFIRVTAKTTGKAVSWRAIDTGLELFPVDLLKDTKTAVVVANNPGRYRLIAVTAAGDEVSPIAECVIDTTEGGPTPGPGPGPNPGPTPGPVTKAWLIVVEETGEAVAKRGEFLGDKGLADYIKRKAWRWHVVDKDAKGPGGQAPAGLAPYIERARGKALPQAYLVAQDGRVMFEGALPATPADLLAILKKAGGD